MHILSNLVILFLSSRPAFAGQWLAYLISSRSWEGVGKAMIGLFVRARNSSVAGLPPPAEQPFASLGKIL
jgi:hypothetical protein